MKFRNLLPAFIFLLFAASLNAQAQFDVRGSINGRIVSSTGSGVRRASVTLMNLTTFETKVRTTNDFGYFRFDDLPISDLYVVTVGAKRYRFSLPNQIVQFTTTEHSLLFTADD